MAGFADVLGDEPLVVRWSLNIGEQTSVALRVADHEIARELGV